jgi:hypothetical protein
VDSNTTSVICYSTDGINWSSYTTTWRVSGAGFDGEKFIFIIHDANDTQRYVYSTDGINWSEPQGLSIDAYVSDPQNPHSIKFINNKYYITILAFGGNATVFTSSALNGPWDRIFNVYYTNFQIATSCVLNNELNLFSGGDFGGTQQAGGYGNQAKKSKAYIIYMNGQVKKAKANSSSIIQPGCEIIVPTKEKNQFKLQNILSIATTSASLATMVASIANILK